ncbi:MAG: helix-turn-helix domain-containing protein [Phycisphaerae bacterium]|nr:helix-turn-helix domain-containing protein [Phycisphaerae bacterium]
MTDCATWLACRLAVWRTCPTAGGSIVYVIPARLLTIAVILVSSCFRFIDSGVPIVRVSCWSISWSVRPMGNAAELERRRRAVASLEDGYSTTEVAERVGSGPRSVRRWRQAHEEKGEEALAAIPSPRRPSKL